MGNDTAEPDTPPRPPARLSRWPVIMLHYSRGMLRGTFEKRREMLRPFTLGFVILVCAAVVVAVAIKVVGALLIAAMLIIPAATARPFASTPERMVLAAACIGALSVAGGLQVSLYWDTPTGPSIVCVVALLFAVSSGAQMLLRGARG